MQYVSGSAKQTLKIASEFAEQLKDGDVVLLNGDLGAGKTVFAKGVGRALGVKETIVSPTFTILRQYKGSGVTLNHIDAYRLEGKPYTETGILDEIGKAGTVTLIEWAQFIDTVRVTHTVSIALQGDKRLIQILFNSTAK